MAEITPLLPALMPAFKPAIALTPAERSDVLFYLLYAVAAKTLNKKEMDFNDLSLGHLGGF
jgi:hypothetical protein